MGIGYAFFPFAGVFPGAAALPAAVLKMLVVLFSLISHSLDAFPLSLHPRSDASGGRSLRLLSDARSRPPPAARPLPRDLSSSVRSLVFSALLVFTPFRPRSPDLRVTMIDVGQGESLLVELPGGRTMVIDGGGLASSPFDVGERVVSPGPVAQEHHPHRLPRPDPSPPDHLDGLVALARNFRIGEFWEGLPAPDEGLYAALLRSLPARCPRRRCSRGTRVDIGPVTVDVLHPPRPDAQAGPVPAANENSLVIRMTFAGTSFLFTGDAGPETEQSLLGSGLDLKCDVLKAGHHGSAASTSADFLAAVKPRLVLVSVGEGNTYGFPSPGLLARCAAAGAEVLRADLDGAVEIRANGRTLAIRTAAPHTYAENPDLRLTHTTKSMIITVD